MNLAYLFSIYAYYLSILFASPFNRKAKLWLKGRKKLLQSLKEKIINSDHIIWFHAASLGEFEQGRPVIEKIKTQDKQVKILLTFFSPSGYEVRKNYENADYIFYLPLDTKRNAKKFISIVKPEKAYFIKYEYWYHYLYELNKRKIPVYSISSIFRKDQIFFKWYSGAYKKMLTFFDHFFVQNRESCNLLYEKGFTNVTISGDTRFDRVAEIVADVKKIEIADEFVKNSKVIIAGSTWEKDEELLIDYINNSQAEIKFILAPHQIHEAQIVNLISKIKTKTVRFSQAEKQNINTANVLIIDNIGMLSSLYQYGHIAYIGGGFGVGIHNILEAAAFGIPMVFGPNYCKFDEAKNLIQLGGAYSIKDLPELFAIFNLLLTDNDKKKQAGDIAKKYVTSGVGATAIILKNS